MNHHQKGLLKEHFRGETDKGTKFVYCPNAMIVSWNFGDYDHWYCPACHKFFREIEYEQAKTPEVSDLS